MPADPPPGETYLERAMAVADLYEREVRIAVDQFRRELREAIEGDRARHNAVRALESHALWNLHMNEHVVWTRAHHLLIVKS